MVDVTSLLPPNATPLEQAMEKGMEQISTIPVQNDILWNADNCPAPFLPFLGWALSVDNWDSSWSEEIKRRVIKNAFKIQQYKGTTGSMKDALNALGSGLQVDEWWQYGGEPYHFRIRISTGSEITDLESLVKVALSAKNERSVMDNLVVDIKSIAQAPKIGAVLKTGADNKIFPEVKSELGISSLFTHPAICFISYHKIRIEATQDKD